MSAGSWNKHLVRTAKLAPFAACIAIDPSFAVTPKLVGAVQALQACRSSTRDLSSKGMPQLAPVRVDVTTAAGKFGDLLATVQDPAELNEQIVEAERAAALTPDEQRQVDITNDEVRRLMARGAFGLAATVKQRNDRVLAQILDTDVRRMALKRKQSLEADMRTQIDLDKMLEPLALSYERSRSRYEEAVASTLSGAGANGGTVRDFLRLEAEVVALSGCPLRNGGAGNVTIKVLAQQAEAIVPDLNEQVATAISANSTAASLTSALGPYRASQALRLNSASAAVLVKGELAIAALQEKERAAALLAAKQAADEQAKLEAQRAAAERLRLASAERVRPFVNDSACHWRAWSTGGIVRR